MNREADITGARKLYKYYICYACIRSMADGRCGFMKSSCRHLRGKHFESLKSDFAHSVKTILGPYLYTATGAPNPYDYADPQTNKRESAKWYTILALEI
jgi:hypothetical protein